MFNRQNFKVQRTPKHIGGLGGYWYVSNGHSMYLLRNGSLNEQAYDTRSLYINDLTDKSLFVLLNHPQSAWCKTRKEARTILAAFKQRRKEALEAHARGESISSQQYIGQLRNELKLIQNQKG